MPTLSGQAGSGSVRESSWWHRKCRAPYDHGLALSSLPGQEGFFPDVVGLNLQGAGGAIQNHRREVAAVPTLSGLPRAVTLLRLYERMQGTRLRRSNAIAGNLRPFHKGAFSCCFNR